MHWGLLVRRDEALTLERMPAWQEVPVATRLELLQRIAVTGTRRLNRASCLPEEYSVDERAKPLSA